MVAAIAPWHEAYHPRVDFLNHRVWTWQPPFLFKPFELSWTPFMGSFSMSIMLFTFDLAYPPITPPWSCLKLLNIPQNYTPIRTKWSCFELPKISQDCTFNCVTFCIETNQKNLAHCISNGNCRNRHLLETGWWWWWCLVFHKKSFLS